MAIIFTVTTTIESEVPDHSLAGIITALQALIAAGIPKTALLVSTPTTWKIQVDGSEFAEKVAATIEPTGKVVPL